ncbi:MAG: shikimate kinase [Rhodomicrobium sp.]
MQKLQSERFVTAEGASETAKLARTVRGALGNRSVVFVGMMGSGKSSIGRRLALALELPFSDADAAIEQAAGMTVEDIFGVHGEPYFREGEERVIKRLLQTGPQVIATGGGAVLSGKTRSEIASNGVSIWLKAPVELLLQRVSRRDNRPLLKTADPRAVLTRLLSEREAHYAEATLVYQSRDCPHEAAVDEILLLLASYLGRGDSFAKEGASALNGNERNS